MISLTHLLVLFVGGGLGTVCRYAISVWMKNASWSIPAGTFIANVISSFLIGFFAAYFMKHSNDTMRLLFITGYCGGFSTFSTFSFENYELLQQGKWVELLLYIAASVIVCIFSVFVGMKAGSLTS